MRDKGGRGQGWLKPYSLSLAPLPAPPEGGCQGRACASVPRRLQVVARQLGFECIYLQERLLRGCRCRVCRAVRVSSGEAVPVCFGSFEA